MINICFSDDVDETAIHKLDKSYTSRVAEEFYVILKTLSIGMDFVNEDDIIGSYDNSLISDHTIDNYTYMCTDYQAFLLEKLSDIRNSILEKHPIITIDRLNELILQALEDKNIVGDGIKEDLRGLFLQGSDELIDAKSEEIRLAVNDSDGITPPKKKTTKKSLKSSKTESIETTTKNKRKKNVADEKSVTKTKTSMKTSKKTEKETGLKASKASTRKKNSSDEINDALQAKKQRLIKSIKKSK